MSRRVPEGLADPILSNEMVERREELRSEFVEELREFAAELEANGPNMVDHPAHYGGAANPYEHVKVMRAWGLVGNAFLYNCTKYIARMGKKEIANPLEDLRKARWYLDEAIKDLENKE